MRAQAAAFVALLDDNPNLPVYDGEVPTGATEADRYVVVFMTTPRQESGRLSADRSLREYTATTMSVGTSPNECRWVAEKVHAALTRKRPAVANVVTAPITLITAGQVRKDTGVNPPVWICTDVWRFSATA